MDSTKAQRTILVKSVEVGEKRFLLGEENPSNEEYENPWYLTVWIEEGFLPSESLVYDFKTEAEAIDFAADFTVGGYLDHKIKSHRDSSFRALTQKMMSNKERRGTFFGKISMGDYETPLALDTLMSAGLCDWSGPSETVIAFIGEKRWEEIAQQFGEHSFHAAIFEYSWINLPHSSPAYVAAAFHFHRYISENYISAGYYWRDLEILTNGMEVVAKKTKTTRENAGAGGTKKSQEAQQLRRAELFERLENMLHESPFLIAMKLPKLAILAADQCIESNPKLWTRGKGKAADYLNQIRDGEAGQELKERYQALFP